MPSDAHLTSLGFDRKRASLALYWQQDGPLLPLPNPPLPPPPTPSPSEESDKEHSEQARHQTALGLDQAATYYILLTRSLWLVLHAKSNCSVFKGQVPTTTSWSLDRRYCTPNTSASQSHSQPSDELPPAVPLTPPCVDTAEDPDTAEMRLLLSTNCTHILEMAQGPVIQSPPDKAVLEVTATIHGPALTVLTQQDHLIRNCSWTSLWPRFLFLTPRPTCHYSQPSTTPGCFLTELLSGNDSTTLTTQIWPQSTVFSYNAGSKLFQPPCVMQIRSRSPPHSNRSSTSSFEQDGYLRASSYLRDRSTPIPAAIRHELQHLFPPWDPSP
jgi:hypothetical protein